MNHDYYNDYLYGSRKKTKTPPALRWNITSIKDTVTIIFYVAMLLSLLVAVIFYFGGLGHKIESLSEDVKEIKGTLKSIENSLRHQPRDNLDGQNDKSKGEK